MQVIRELLIKLAVIGCIWFAIAALAAFAIGWWIGEGDR